MGTTWPWSAVSPVIAAKDHPRHEPLSPVVEIAEGSEFRRHYRRLAIRVIALAWEDLTLPGRSAADRASARSFFRPSWTLTHWCTLAAVDPKRLVRCAGEFDGESRHP